LCSQYLFSEHLELALDLIQLYLSRPDVTWFVQLSPFTDLGLATSYHLVPHTRCRYYPLIGLLSVVLGIGCALAASLLPLPSIATLQFARAIQTNMLVLLCAHASPRLVG
jgi:hypothetical protein